MDGQTDDQILRYMSNVLLGSRRTGTWKDKTSQLALGSSPPFFMVTSMNDWRTRPWPPITLPEGGSTAPGGGISKLCAWALVSTMS